MRIGLKNTIIAVIVSIALIISIGYDIKRKNAFNDKLTVEFIDVENADSIFIRFPNKETMLIDSGVSSSFPKIQKTLEKYGTKKIDYAFLTHQHDDVQLCLE